MTWESKAKPPCWWHAPFFPPIMSPVISYLMQLMSSFTLREHVFHVNSCKRLCRFWMSATTYVIVSEQCLGFFSLPNLSQYHRALFKVAVSFDQTQNFTTAAEPPGLHSLAAWWGLLRQNSFRYCETQFLQWRHRLSLSAVRWLTPHRTSLLKLRISNSNKHGRVGCEQNREGQPWMTSAHRGGWRAGGVGFSEPELGQLGSTRTYSCTSRNLY